jgi:hypothetical protein
MIKRGVIGFFLLLGLLAGARPEESDLRLSTKQVRDEVKAVVEGQLAALQAGDFATAYAFAARGLKAQFDVRVFTLMLKRGYAPLLKHDSADLGLVHDNGRGAAQVAVTVVDGLQRSTAYRYWLVLEPDGWRITGVVLEQKPPRGDT